MSYYNPAGRVPRGEQFADPSARAVWAALCALDPASQHDVLAELQERLGAPVLASSDVRTRRAIAALREAAEILGRSPSVGDYRRLQAERRELDWPPDGSLRKWLGGSWNDCLARAHLEAVADGDVLLTPLGPSFEEQELVDALRACAADVGSPPTLSAYLCWARRPDVQARPGRRPRSQGPFDRFGGYANVLIASGLITGDGAFVMPATTRVRLGQYHASEEVILAALREVADRLGRPPRSTDYQLERLKIIRESDATGQLRTIPDYGTVNRRYGTWDTALVAAGLQPLGGRATGGGGKKNKGRKAPRVTEEMIFDAIREAYAQLGDPFRSDAYKTWRLNQAERDRATGVYRELPSYDTIQSRYGTWKNAVLAALPRRGGRADSAASTDAFGTEAQDADSTEEAA